MYSHIQFVIGSSMSRLIGHIYSWKCLNL